MDIGAFRIIRSKRKTIALEICNDATLIIRAPFHVGQDYIQKLVDEKRTWIDKKLFEQCHRPQIKKKFVNGEEFLYLGCNYKLCVIDNQLSVLTFENGFLLNKKYLDNARNEFIRWYKEQASLTLAERAAFYSLTLGLKYKKVSITNARRRWGSCGAGGTLNFSWRLIMAPQDVIDYVVAHEIIHLRVRNHSGEFWKRVAELFPGYKRCEMWLKENGHLMVI